MFHKCTVSGLLAGSEFPFLKLRNQIEEIYRKRDMRFSLAGDYFPKHCDTIKPLRSFVCLAGKFQFCHGGSDVVCTY